MWIRKRIYPHSINSFSLKKVEKWIVEMVPEESWKNSHRNLFLLHSGLILPIEWAITCKPSWVPNLKMEFIVIKSLLNEIHHPIKMRSTYHINSSSPFRLWNVTFSYSIYSLLRRFEFKFIHFLHFGSKFDFFKFSLFLTFVSRPFWSSECNHECIFFNFFF